MFFNFRSFRRHFLQCNIGRLNYRQHDNWPPCGLSVSRQNPARVRARQSGASEKYAGINAVVFMRGGGRQNLRRHGRAAKKHRQRGRRR